MDSFPYTRVLVTGGCGFIGSNALHYWVPKYPETLFVCLDAMTYAGSMDNIASLLKEEKEGKKLHENFIFVKGRCEDTELVTTMFQTYKFETVIHFAAETHVDRSFKFPLEFTKSNVTGTHTLLEVARTAETKLKRFCHISTDETLGGTDPDAQLEEDAPLNPTNPYARSKAMAEDICNTYTEFFDMPIVMLRPNNVIGPNQYPEKVIPRFIHALYKDGKCPIHGEGKSARNFLFVNDLVDAIQIVLGKGLDGHVYHVSANEAVTIKTLAHTLIKHIKYPDEKEVSDAQLDAWCQYIPDRLAQDAVYSTSCKKIEALGWHQQTNFETALQKTLDAAQQKTTLLKLKPLATFDSL